MLTNGIQIKKITQGQLYEMAKFVVDQNFIHHESNTLPADYHELVDNVFQEEKNFFGNSTCFGAMNRLGRFIGCIRVLRWNKVDELPLEKIFGLNIRNFVNINDERSIWHIGRFAVTNGYSPLELFKQFILCAISPICEETNAIAFAECDAKLLRALARMGIESNIIDNPITYLGSETVPVYMMGKTLKDFYEKNSIRPKRSMVYQPQDSDPLCFSL